MLLYLKKAAVHALVFLGVRRFRRDDGGSEAGGQVVPGSQAERLCQVCCLRGTGLQPVVEPSILSAAIYDRPAEHRLPEVHRCPRRSWGSREPVVGPMPLRSA